MTLAAWGVAWVGLGGALAGSLLGMHGVLFVACLFALRMHDHHLERAGAMWSWLAAGGLIALAPLLSLCPLPASLLAVTAPERLTAWPGLAYAPSTHAPWSTLSGLAQLSGAVTFAVLLTLIAVRGSSRRRAERGVTALAALIVLVALWHGATGARTAFGVLPVQAAGVRFLPIVNPNHLSALVLLTLPVLIGRAATAKDEAERWVTGTVLLGSWILLLLLQSTTGLGLGFVVTLVSAARVGVPRGVLLGVGLASLPGGLAWRIYGPHAGSTHVIERISHWGDTLQLWLAHWLLGSGLGTYGDAIRPFRSDHAFVRWTHAHNEPLHWLAETGVVGASCGLVALWILRPRASTSSPSTAWRIDLGLLSLAIYALVEFPLHLPAVAFAACGLWAVRLSVHAPKRMTSARAVRASVAALAVLQLLAAALTGRDMIVRHAVSRYAEGEVTLLVRWAPNHPLLALQELDAGPQAVLSRAADAPDVLVTAADRLMASLRDAEALMLLEHAARRAPADRRIPMLQARALTRSNRSAEAAAAWARAFEKGAPSVHVRAAWQTLPMGQWWLDALMDARAAHHVALARAVMSTEPNVAIEALQIAIARAPQYSSIPDMARALRLAGRVDDARVWTARAVLTTPEHAGLWWEHALALAPFDQDAARDAARRAAVLDRRFAARAVRFTAEHTGRDNAIALARDLQLRNHLTPAGRIELARAHLRSGHTRDCLAELERLAPTDPALEHAKAELQTRCTD